MRPSQNKTPAEAEKNLTQIPTLMSREFYSPWGDPVLVASMPAAWRSSTQEWEGARLRQAAKESLARFLAQHLLERELPDLSLDSDPLGKPQIWLGAAPGPALSFSWSAGRLWAAIGRSGSGLGLDAAAPEEFAEPYPHQRVFLEAEWQTAITLAAGDPAEGAALLWSVKEAVVKANGCGFHFFSPREVKVQFTAPGENGYLWSGCLENPDQDGNLPGGWEPCPAVSVRLQEVWLAVAWCR